MCGEEWLISKTGAYLPGAYEQVVGFISAYVLTENIALHLEALQSYKDRFDVDRKSGEQWLITINVSTTSSCTFTWCNIIISLLQSMTVTTKIMFLISYTSCI